MLTKRAMNSKAVIDLLLFSVNFFFSLFFKNRRSRWLMLLTSPFVPKSATKAFAKAFWQYFLNSNELSNELSKISFLSRIIVLASVRQFLMEREKKKKRNLDQDQGLFGRKKNRRCYLSEDTCMHFCNVPDARFQVMPYGGASVIGDLDDFSGSRIAGSCATRREDLYSVTRLVLELVLNKACLPFYGIRASCSFSPLSNLISAFICIRISAPLVSNNG